MRNRRRSVLIAESNRTIAQSLRRHLELAGFSVLLASDGEQACILAARQRFELIITNLELSVMNGTKFCHHVREDLQLTDVPIAVWAGVGLEDQAANLVINYGIAQVFSTPVDHESIVEFARETVGNLMATA
jgi:CheY-like chemotaxis protein